MLRQPTMSIATMATELEGTSWIMGSPYFDILRGRMGGSGKQQQREDSKTETERMGGGDACLAVTEVTDRRYNTS